MMTSDQIENLKQNFTDKYVVVDARRPELSRFRDHVGQVKTVNMSGRALVQFADYHLNIGWYDIDLNFLKVVPKPDIAAKQPAEKKHAAPAKKPVEKTEAKPAAAKAPAAGKPSVADILAAARGGGAAKPAATASPAAPKPSAPAAKTDAKKMSTADILAAARGKAAAEAPAPVAKAPAEKPAPPAEPAPKAEESAPAPTPAPAKAPATAVDKKSMTIDQMVAWCREHDAN
jgi:hypothetical protein